MLEKSITLENLLKYLEHYSQFIGYVRDVGYVECKNKIVNIKNLPDIKFRIPTGTAFCQNIYTVNIRFYPNDKGSENKNSEKLTVKSLREVISHPLGDKKLVTVAPRTKYTLLSSQEIGIRIDYNKQKVRLQLPLVKQEKLDFYPKYTYSTGSAFPGRRTIWEHTFDEVKSGVLGEKAAELINNQNDLISNKEFSLFDIIWNSPYRKIISADRLGFSFCAETENMYFKTKKRVPHITVERPTALHENLRRERDNAATFINIKEFTQYTYRQIYLSNNM